MINLRIKPVKVCKPKWKIVADSKKMLNRLTNNKHVQIIWVIGCYDFDGNEERAEICNKNAPYADSSP